MKTLRPRHPEGLKSWAILERILYLFAKKWQRSFSKAYLKKRRQVGPIVQRTNTTRRLRSGKGNLQHRLPPIQLIVKGMYFLLLLLLSKLYFQVYSKFNCICAPYTGWNLRFDRLESIPVYRWSRTSPRGEAKYHQVFYVFLVYF